MSARHSKWLRRGAALATAVALAVVTAGCSQGPGGSGDSGSGDSDSPRTLTIGYSARASFVLPALLAEEGTEEFSSRGLKFEGQLIAAPDALPLLATGKLDVFAGPVSAGIFNAIATGADIGIVAPNGYSTQPSYWYISKAALGDKDYSLDAWNGQTVYTSTGSGSYVMISLAHELAAAGLKPTDLKFTQISPDDVGPALTSGAIFAGIPASTKVRDSLLGSGDIFAGPSAEWPKGISPGFIFFGSSLLKDDPKLAQTVLDAFADVETNRLQGDYQHDPDTAAVIAKVLDLEVDQIPTFVTNAYTPDMSFPDGWTENAEDVWRSLPDVLNYDDSVADKVVRTDLIKKALADIGK